MDSGLSFVGAYGGGGASPVNRYTNQASTDLGIGPAVKNIAGALFDPDEEERKKRMQQGLQGLTSSVPGRPAGGYRAPATDRSLSVLSLFGDIYG